MKRILSTIVVISLVILSVFALTGCDKTWHTQVGYEAKCGGNIGDIEYKAYANVYKNMSSEQIREQLEDKLREGYDIAVGIYESDSLRILVNCNKEKGYDKSDAQTILLKLQQMTEAKGEYTQDIFIEVTQNYMKQKYQHK